MPQDKLIFLAAVGVVVLLTLVMAAISFSSLMGPWLRAYLSGGQVSIAQILGMRLRRTPVNMILDEYLALVHSQVDIRLAEIESLYIANRTSIYEPRDLHQCVENFLKAEGRMEKP